MSWQAQTAVNHHSKQQKLHLFKLMGYLADVADASGAVNKAPAQSTLATFYNVSDRTVRNWLDELIASGELTQTRIGSGQGNPSAYQINLPMPTGKGEENPGKVETKVEKVEEITAFLSTFAQQLEEIKVEINQLKASTFTTKGGKGGNERWKRWKRKVETPSRGGVHTSQDQTKIVPNKKDIYIAPLPPVVTSMITALAQISKTPYAPGFNEKEYEDAAYLLIGQDIRAEQVLTFGPWWETNGWHKGKPVLKIALQEMDNALKGVVPVKKSANGHGRKMSNAEIVAAAFADVEI